MADTLIPVKAKYTGTDVTSLGEYASGEKIPVTYIPSIEGTTVASTGETGTTKFLRVDGDGTCSWQTTPDTDTVYTHPNHSGEVTSTGDGATVIANDVVDEANLKVSNAPTDGFVLTAQSGNTGGLTWAADSTTDSTKLPLTGGTMTGTTTLKGITETEATNSTATYTVDLANGTIFDLTSATAVAITMPAEVAGKSFTIIAKTAPTSWTSTPAILWASGTAPTATTISIYSFICDGTTWYGMEAGNGFA